MTKTSLPLDAGRTLRVLIVRIGAMGDVLHAMPAVAALRELHPDWPIGWAIEPGWMPFLRAGDAVAGRSSAMPMVDRVHLVPTRDWKRRPLALSTLGEIRGLRRELRAERYDVCVDMQGLIRSAVVGRMAGTPIFAGAAEPREGVAAWLYGRRVKLSATHVVERGCELLGAATGETLRPERAPLPTDAAAENWCDGLLARGERFAMMAPTAGWGAKEWPAERFGAVAAGLRRVGVRTLVNAAHAGDEVGMRVVAASEGAATLVPCSVAQMIALVRRAGVVIAGDTGPLHLAAALERPVVGLFGPTDPARTGPFGTKACVLRHGSSVTDHSRRAETEDGLVRITVEEVEAAALELLGGRGGMVDG
jgi:heptosyltransferase-1